MFFHVAHNIFQFFAMAANYHVHVAGHYAPSINFQALVLLTVPPRVKQNIFVFITYKKVYPIDNREGYKVQPFLIAEFIFGTHYELNIEKRLYS